MNYSLYPYIFQAMYDWFVNSEGDPRILIDATNSYVSVPREFVSPQGKIVLGIHPRTITELVVMDTGISFYARFKGKKTKIVVPYMAIEEFYSVEHQVGIRFNIWMSALVAACGMAPNGYLDSIITEDDENEDDLLSYFFSKDVEEENFDETTEKKPSKEENFFVSTEPIDADAEEEPKSKKPKKKPVFSMVEDDE